MANTYSLISNGCNKDMIYEFTSQCNKIANVFKCNIRLLFNGVPLLFDGNTKEEDAILSYEEFLENNIVQDFLCN